MTKYGFIQVVSRPTRITDHSVTLIDHVYSSDVYNTLSCNVLTLDISDHLATLTTPSLGGHSSHKVEFPNSFSSDRTEAQIEHRLFNEANNLTFKHLIEEESWDEVFFHGGADAQYDKFCEIYTKHYNSAYPIKSKRVRRKNERRDPKPWALPWHEDAFARKQKLYHISVEKPTIANITTYKKMNKFCEKHKNRAKQKYYKKYFDKYKENSRKQWQMINELLNRKTRNSEPIKLKGEDGNIISSSAEVANSFNDYFSNIASNIKSHIRARETFDPGGFETFLHNPSSDFFSINPVQPDEVYNVIKSFKNKATLDTKIEPLKIANSNYSFTTALAKVINTSFEQGIFPQSLKTARVIPVHKEGSKMDVTNYRPISLLSSFSKIYEKLMHTRLLNFLESNESIFENQYGFRPGRSCEHALLNAQSTILHSLNKKEIALLLLLDYSKAFDVLDHPVLIKKLYHYGIRGIALQWFESYLSNRQQFVTVNGTDSSPKDILYGVPQGSILGPLLFVIYINDLPGISNIAKFILYADDANIIITGSTVQEILQKVQNITSCLVTWVDSNGLSLNLKKTKYMIFTRQNINLSSIEVNIAGKDIERKTEARFLGVIIDEKLVWSHHI